MSRDYRLYLDDIETSAEKILRYTKGLAFFGFTQDTKSFDAVVLNLQIIGEAPNTCPMELGPNTLKWIGVALLVCAMLSPMAISA